MTFVPFADRQDAGRRLAERLLGDAGRNEVVDSSEVVLGLPRGGVPVAFEVARALRAPLDVLTVRKLGVPDQPELAMGAIASGGTRVLNEDVLAAVPEREASIDRVTREEARELQRREQVYRDGRLPLPVAGRSVVIVDDGLATGATMRAAIASLDDRAVSRVTVAVPVGTPEVCAALAEEADHVICLITPEVLGGVGTWYADFFPTEDDEVCALLREARRMRS